MSKARKLSYWIGLFCVAVLVLMPDITVNAQPDPDGQGSNRQMPNKIGQGTDTQTSAAKQQTSAAKQQTPPAKQQTPEELRGDLERRIKEKKEAEQRLLEVGCQLVSAKSVTSGPQKGWPLNVYECPAGFHIEGLMREAEQSLIDAGCQKIRTTPNTRDGSVWNVYNCPPGSKFHHTGGGVAPPGEWRCVGSPDKAYVPYWLVNAGAGVIMLDVDADLMREECVPPAGPQGGLRQRQTKDGQSPREVTVNKIPEPAPPEPAPSGPQGESAQQQANEEAQAKSDWQQAESDQPEAQNDSVQADEEANAAGNKASNESQDNDDTKDTKKRYGCSASP